MSDKKENVVMDERTMIREQERLAKEAKQKKTKKYKIILSVVLAVILIGTAWYVVWGRSFFAQTAANTTVEIKKSAGQEVVIVQITSIKGNEITYAIAEEVSAEETQGSEVSKDEAGRGEMSNTAIPTEGMSMPDMSQMGGDIPGRRNAVTTGSDVDQFVYDGITYRIGEENVTTYIPVGTDVTTKLGTVTTFSRLAANDYVALVIEKDGDKEIIAAVYIIG